MNYNISEAIKKAKKYGFSVNETEWALFITTPKSSWWIDYSKEDKIILWHRNMRNNNKNKDSFETNYHYQRKLNSITEGIKYIKYHDERKYTSKESRKYAGQNKRMDKLFRQIEEERKRKNCV